MAAKSPSSSSLPDIHRTSSCLVEAAGEATRSPSSSLLLHTESPPPSLARSEPPRPAAVLSRRAAGGGTAHAQASKWMLQAVTVPLTPRPPSPSTQPHAGRAQYVRVARGDLEKKDQTIATLRSESMQLQAKVRELQSSQGNHAMLQSACTTVAQCLGCSVEGVAAEAVGDVLMSKASGLSQDCNKFQQQLSSLRRELEAARGEAATAAVRLPSLQAQLQQKTSALVARETELEQMKVQMENLQVTHAKTSSSLKSLQQQMEEVEAQNSGRGSSERLTELHSEVGRLKSVLKKKEEEVLEVQGRLAASQDEGQTLQERVISAEAGYEEFCQQLSSALQLEESDSCDVESLIAQVGGLVQECSELRLRTDTLVKALKTCELDSKASRETILRLVSETKKHDKVAARLSELEQLVEDERTQLEAVERERDSLQERLMSARETLAAQETELQAKQSRMSELLSSWQSLKATSDAERELIESKQQNYEELCMAIAGLVGCDTSTDCVELLHTLQQQLQMSRRQESPGNVGEREEEREKEEEDAATTVRLQLEAALEEERLKVKQLEGELVAESMVRDGLSRELEKSKVFQHKMTGALRLDSATAKILAGDFAHDAILTRADQLVQHETQALAEKQSALYSVQRQLKGFKKNLQNKELYVSLLQRKVAALEEAGERMSRQQTEAESVKGRKLEKQVERCRRKISQQSEEIERLTRENTELQSLRGLCNQQEEQVASLVSRVEVLSEARVEQARQLAEVRSKLQGETDRERRRSAGQEREREKEIQLLQQQLKQAREREEQSSSFRLAVQRLLSEYDSAHPPSGAAPGDYDIIARLEHIVATDKQHKETVKCLGSSLQQLEHGFRTSYSDTLTLLQTKA